jgi:lipopolysaccharide heptosyltransferase II
VRLLIVLPGAIGDVVRALPLLGRLRRAWPDAHVVWAVEPPSAPLLAGHPWLDRAIVFERHRGVRAFVPFLRAVRAERCTVALDLGRSAKSALVARASGAGERLGFARADGREGGWLLATRCLPPQGTARSKLEQFLAFGDLLGVPPAPVAFGLAPSPREEREALAFTGDLGKRLVAACVGSSCGSRRWFPERTAAVLRTLRQRHRTGAVLLGARGDVAFAIETMRDAPRAVRDLVGRTTLRQLLAILARSAVVFGPDSGALHLAAAVGRPVVSLWGATSPLRSTPWGGDALAVQGVTPCAPCFLTECPIGRVCMRTIDVDAVVERASAVLAA